MTYPVEVFTRDGHRFAIWRARLQDEMPYVDLGGNPLLWWSRSLDTREMVAVGFRTKFEALVAVDEWIIEQAAWGVA